MNGALRLALLVALADLYYLLFLALVAPFLLVRLATSSRYREGFARRFGLFVAPRSGERPAVWVHGVSVGEILAARGLIAEIRRGRPEIEVVLTTTTRTGHAVARKTYPDLAVHYFPVDLGGSVRRVFRRLRPSLLVLVELELWPNVLLTAHRLGIPVAVVNGRITQRSFSGYRLIRWALAPGLSRLGSACVQTFAYGERLVALGVPADRVRVTGSLKYDAVDVTRAEAERERTAARLALSPEDRVLVAGSTHPGEEAPVLAALAAARARAPGARLVLVPRHPERVAEAEAAVRAAGERPVRLTALDRSEVAPASARGAVVIGDTMGDLGSLYAVATAVFVGGSLVPHGGQNVLEPAALGKPVVVGPYTFNFREPVDLLRGAGALEVVPDGAALPAALGALLADPAAGAERGARGRAAVEAARGATGRTIAILREEFPGLLARNGSPS
ncbi:MAG: 3-deoxy-D-manno-octulosonic acid transferase [Planctomycetales bacterium]|nr:3-deoxy-D-manno-octulosonic acid transferase [Planctomycetales bacterium]